MPFLKAWVCQPWICEKKVPWDVHWSFFQLCHRFVNVQKQTNCLWALEKLIGFLPSTAVGSVVTTGFLNSLDFASLYTIFKLSWRPQCLALIVYAGTDCKHSFGVKFWGYIIFKCCLRSEFIAELALMWKMFQDEY